MLKYFVDSTEQLMLMMLALGLIFGYLKAAYDRKSRRYCLIASGAGLVISAVMMYFKVYTDLIDTAFWNMWIFIVSIAALIALIVFVAIEKRREKAGRIGASVSATVLAVSIIFYYFPPFLEYPHTMLLGEDSIVSSTFILELIGIIFGFILTFIAGAAMYNGAARIGRRNAFIYMLIVNIINSAKYAGIAFGVMLARRYILSNHILFVISVFTTNHSSWFIYGSMIACLIFQIQIIISSLRYNEPYKNPAQHRKIKAKWRRRRRWAITAIVTSALAVFVLTAVSGYANREVELSPIEDAKVEDGNVVVSFNQVNDGNLHRFGYTTDEGTTIRFIVIQKPNSSAYGIGLDACDICGETGYYQKDDQVVCNLCDVVMNINTIGFKGGCNPIVIDYTIENGNILVPIDGLVEHESEFK